MSKIEIRNLSFTYEDNHQRFEALKKIDLSIPGGRVCMHSRTVRMRKKHPFNRAGRSGKKYGRRDPD